jgi:hypothetical protein
VAAEPANYECTTQAFSIERKQPSKIMIQEMLLCTYTKLIFSLTTLYLHFHPPSLSQIHQFILSNSSSVAMKVSIAFITTLCTGIIATPVAARNPKDGIQHLHDTRDNEDLSTVDAVNYIVNLHKTTDGISAYDDEINAVSNPADILGKRNDDNIDAVNYIVNLHKTTDGVSAYDDEINAVENPVDVLG